MVLRTFVFWRIFAELSEYEELRPVEAAKKKAAGCYNELLEPRTPAEKVLNPREASYAVCYYGNPEKIESDALWSFRHFVLQSIDADIFVVPGVPAQKQKRRSGTHRGARPGLS